MHPDPDLPASPSTPSSARAPAATGEVWGHRGLSLENILLLRNASPARSNVLGQASCSLSLGCAGTLLPGCKQHNQSVWWDRGQGCRGLVASLAVHECPNGPGCLREGLDAGGTTQPHHFFLICNLNLPFLVQNHYPLKHPYIARASGFGVPPPRRFRVPQNSPSTAHRMHGRTDGRMEGWTDGRGQHRAGQGAGFGGSLGTGGGCEGRWGHLVTAEGATGGRGLALPRGTLPLRPRAGN